eukprot:jgi/Mesvir1/11104/Mv12053-RA.1
MAGKSDKRRQPQSEPDGGSKRRRDYDGPDTSQDNTFFRLLIPRTLAGQFIGKDGNVVKKLRKDSGCHIKLPDPLYGEERMIVISGVHKESEEWSPPQEGLLLSVKKINDIFREEGDDKGVLVIRMLLNPGESGAVIGKGGNVVKSIREKSGALIKIGHRGEGCADPDDCLMQVSGELDAVLAAFRPLSTRIRDAFGGMGTMLSHPPEGPSHGRPSVHSRLDGFPGDMDRGFHNDRGPRGGYDEYRDQEYGGMGRGGPEYGRGMGPPRDIQDDLPPSMGGRIGVGMGSGAAPGGGCEVFTLRVLVPEAAVGSLIGRRGETIKAMRADAGAEIHIGEASKGVGEVPVTITADENDPRMCHAQEGLYMILNHVNMSSPVDNGGKWTVRLVVAHRTLAHLIGKGGRNIRALRADSGADVQVPDKKDLPSCLKKEDGIMQVVGSVNEIRKALEAIIAQLRAVASDGASGGGGGGGNAPMPQPPPRAGGYPSPGFPDQGPPPPRGPPAGGGMPGGGMPGGALERETWPPQQPPQMPPMLDPLEGEGWRMHQQQQQPSPMRPQQAPQQMPSDYSYPQQRAPAAAPPAYGGAPGGGMFSSDTLPGLSGRDFFPSAAPSVLAPLAGVVSTTIRISLPAQVVPAVAGRGGLRLAHVQKMTGAVLRLHDPDEVTLARMLEITGTPEQTQQAQSLVQSLIISSQVPAGMPDAGRPMDGGGRDMAGAGGPPLYGGMMRM